MNPETDSCDCCRNLHSESLAQRQHECRICDIAFSSKDSLSVHKHEYHSNISTDEKIRELLKECLRLLAKAPEEDKVHRVPCTNPVHHIKHDPDTY